MKNSFITFKFEARAQQELTIMFLEVVIQNFFFSGSSQFQTTDGYLKFQMIERRIGKAKNKSKDD